MPTAPRNVAASQGPLPVRLAGTRLSTGWSLLAACLLLAAIARAGEPSLQDLSHEDPKRRAAAIHALSQSNAASAPIVSRILVAMQDPDVGVRQAAAGYLLDQVVPAPKVLARGLEDEDDLVAIFCAGAIAQCGTRALSALPALLDVVSDHAAGASRRDPCLEAIAALGPVAAREALPELTRLLERERKRLLALPDPKSCFSQEQRFTALAAKIVSASADVTAISRLLSFPSAGVRREAAEGLAALGAAARSTTPSLLRLLEDPLGPRDACLHALARVAQPTASLVQRVVRVLRKDPDRAPREAAALALGALGKADPPRAVKALCAALEREDREIYKAALEALATLGPAARAALPTLRDLVERLADDDAARAIKAIERAPN